MLTIQKAFDNFLGGLSCSWKYKELFWEDGRFFILKHIGHPSYQDRCAGTVYCETYYLLCDIKNEKNTEYNYMYGDLKINRIKKYTGRWKKSNMDDVKRIIGEII